jgi:cytochrome c6
MMRNLKTAGLWLVLGGVGPVAHAAPPAPGQLIFQKNCARCHGQDGRLGRSGAHDLTKSNLNAFGRNYLVANGMGKMPAFAKKLTPAQIDEVVAYSLTLK